jgi:hypothetical protein
MLGSGPASKDVWASHSPSMCLFLMQSPQAKLVKPAIAMAVAKMKCLDMDAPFASYMSRHSPDCRCGGYDHYCLIEWFSQSESRDARDHQCDTQLCYHTELGAERV